MYKKNNKQAVIFVIILLSLIMYFAYVTNRNRELNIFEKSFKDLFQTALNIISTPVRMFDNELPNEKNKTTLEIENENLKKELNEMKKLLDLNTVLSSYSIINSTVIKRNTNYWFNEITLDKGSNSGVIVGCAVITKDGFIGKIIRTTKYSSTVLLLPNIEMAVYIKNENKDISGIIEGYKEGNLVISGISDYEEIKLNSKVYTTGFNELIPSGLLIGEVKSIDKDLYGLSNIINVSLSSNLNDLNYVSIVKRNK